MRCVLGEAGSQWMRLRKGRPWRELVGVAARGRWMDGDGSLVGGVVEFETSGCWRGFVVVIQ